MRLLPRPILRKILGRVCMTGSSMISYWQRFGYGMTYVLAVSLLCLAFATPATAQNGKPQLGFAHDTSQPLEITADSLEVAQQNQTAVFVGNVRASQGELQLTADSLRVYYRDQGSSQTPTQGAISRLDAIGNVTMTSPAESATSEWAVYDVDKGAITLGGQVALTRGENIIRGAQLVVDLNTGLSRIVGTGGNQGRVKGVFVPAQQGKK